MSSHGPVEPYKIDDTGIENRDVNYPSLARYIIFMFAFMIGTAIVTVGIWQVFVPRRTVVGETTALPQEARQTPPDPKLQPFPKTEMKVFREEEDVKIKAYAYLDKPAGKVRIPVDRALELVAEEGLPKQTAPMPMEDPSKPNRTVEPTLQTPPPDVDVNRRVLPNNPTGTPANPPRTAPQSGATPAPQ